MFNIKQIKLLYPTPTALRLLFPMILKTKSLPLQKAPQL